MPKKSTKAKPKRTNTRRVAPRPLPRPRPPPLPRIDSRLVAEACGVTDPFCPHARGAKWPDGASVPTLAVPIHNRFAINADGNGQGSVLILPGWNYQYCFGIVGGTTASYSAMSAFANPLTNVYGFRINTFGVRIHSTASNNNASGMLRLRGINVVNGTNLGTADTQSMMNAFCYDIPMRVANDVTYTIPPRDDSAHEFFVPDLLQPSNVVTSSTFPGYGCLQISFDGLPASSAALDIEVYMNCEVTFSDTNGQNTFLTPSKPKSDLLQSAASYISTKLVNTATKSVEALSEEAARYAKSYLSQRLAASVGPRVALAAALTNRMAHLELD